MAGSLKATCAIGTRAWAYTAPFGTLNAQTAFTVSCWIQVDSIPVGTINGDIAAAITNYPFSFGIASAALLSFQAHNHDNSKSINYLPPMDTRGHFVVLSYDGAGTTKIYVDGSAVTPVGSPVALGNTTAADQVLNVGFNATGAAVSVYLKDLALWGGYAAVQQDVIDLRDGTHTPATLGTPATNWWSLQGTPGLITNLALGAGLSDLIGSVPFGHVFTDAPATLTYDVHEITLSSSALMMPPFVDTSGNFVTIPLYLNPMVTLGGPAVPTTVVIPPVFKLNGSVITPSLVTIDPAFYIIKYQLPAAILSTDVLTMSAGLGWASTTAGSWGALARAAHRRTR